MTLSDNRNRAGKTPGHVYAWRFASGHHLDGVRRTDAGWFRTASRDLTPDGRASRWAHRPRAIRAGVRLTSCAITLSILYGYFTARTITVDTVLGALAALTLAAIWRAPYAWLNHFHHARTVRPYWQTATMITASGTIHPHAYGANHRRYISVSRNYRNDPKANIVMRVPETWEGTAKDVKRLTDLTNRRFHGEWDAITHLEQYPPLIEFVKSPAPPSALTFAQMLPAIQRSKDSEMILGKGARDSVIAIDLDAEAPHIAISAGTGGGKSSILRLIVAQLIAKGAERIDILDVKRMSHSWAKNIPGVYVHTTMSSIMNAVSVFRAEMESRYDTMEREGKPLPFPRRVLIIEEQNSLMEMARQYWSDYRAELDNSERSRTPKQNPMIRDIAFILFMGRQSCMNVLSVFQRMTANAAGGTEMRDQYGCKILARFSPQTWKSLVGTTPVPRSSRINGRGIVVLGDEDRAIQMAFITEAEAQEYAIANARVSAEASNDALTSVPIPANAGADDEEMMSLRELCEAGIVPVRYSAATRARTRAGETFPEGKRTSTGTLYRPDAVAEWFGSRPVGGRKSRAN